MRSRRRSGERLNDRGNERFEGWAPGRVVGVLTIAGGTPAVVGTGLWGNSGGVGIPQGQVVRLILRGAPGLRDVCAGVLRRDY